MPERRGPFVLPELPRSTAAGGNARGAVQIVLLRVHELLELRFPGHDSAADIDQRLQALLAAAREDVESMMATTGDARTAVLASVVTGPGRRLLLAGSHPTAARPGAPVDVDPSGARPLQRRCAVLAEDAGGWPRLTILDNARGALLVRGTAALDLLAKGCPLDLQRLAVASGTRSLIGPYSVELYRQSPDALLLLVARSLARSLFDWLLAEAFEFDLQVWGPD